MDTFYANKVGNRPILVRDTGTSKGKAMFAAQSMQPGEVVFSERPLAAMQSVAQRSDVLVCEYCMRFIGTLELQADLVARRCSPANLTPPTWTLPGTATLLASLRDGCAVPSGSSDSSGNSDTDTASTLGGVVGCPQGCGAVYCSEACQRADYDHSHRLLCVGPCTSVTDPPMRFKTHAVQNNEILLLAARVIAHAILRFERAWLCDRGDTGTNA